MQRTVLGLLLLVAVATTLADNDKPVPALISMPSVMETEELLRQFKEFEEAKKADTGVAGQGIIDNNEFAQSLYLQADANSDGDVSWPEFMDAFRTRYPFLPSAVLVRMFILLDGYNNDLPIPLNFTPPCNPTENIFSNAAGLGDGTINSNDITVQDFTNSSSPTVEEYQRGLNTWVKAAIMSVEKFKSRPFEVGKKYAMDFDYEMFFRQLDTNSDEIITPEEFVALLKQISADGTGSVSRAEWLTRMVTTYGQHPYVALILFDKFDDNNDLRLDAEDVSKILERADVNLDQRSTKQEMYRLLQRENNMIRRLLGLPIKPYIYDCAEPVWKETEDCKEALDVTVLMMDIDTDSNGNLTLHEMKKYLWSMDENMDGGVDRLEFIAIQHKRYGQPHAVANIEFDAADGNNDGKLTWDDFEKEFKYQTWTCACEYRLAALASARAAEQLAQERQRQTDLLRMKYFLLMTKALHHVEFPMQSGNMGPMAQWRWQTMNGKPTKEGCTRCTAKDNWAMKDDQDKKDDEEAWGEDDYKMMHTLVAALHRMKVMEKWQQKERAGKMLKMLMWAMHMLNQDSTDDHNSEDVSEMAKFMMWKMETMRMEKIKEKMESWKLGIEWKVKSEVEEWKMRDSEEEKEEKKSESWAPWKDWKQEEPEKKEDETYKKLMEFYKKWQEKEGKGDDKEIDLDKFLEWCKDEQQKKEKPDWEMQMKELMKWYKEQQKKDDKEEMKKKLKKLMEMYKKQEQLSSLASWSSWHPKGKQQQQGGKSWGW